jgi:hypothetical protein
VRRSCNCGQTADSSAPNTSFNIALTNWRQQPAESAASTNSTVICREWEVEREWEWGVAAKGGSVDIAEEHKGCQCEVVWGRRGQGLDRQCVAQEPLEPAPKNSWQHSLKFFRHLIHHPPPSISVMPKPRVPEMTPPYRRAEPGPVPFPFSFRSSSGYRSLTGSGLDPGR